VSGYTDADRQAANNRRLPRREYVHAKLGASLIMKLGGSFYAMK